MVVSTKPPEGASTEVDTGTIGDAKAEAGVDQKTAEEKDAERKAAADATAKAEAESKAAEGDPDKKVESELADVEGVDKDKDKDSDTDSDKHTDTDTNVPATPEKTVDPNASLFSKKRWSAVALDMAKTMVIDSKHTDDSFFSGFGDKLRLVGLKVISWFVGKGWYKELSQEYKDTLNQKFGLKETGDDSIFEFGEPAGGETSTTLESYLKSEDIFKAQFGEEKAFDTIPGLSALKKDGLTFKQFKDTVAGTEITDPALKQKCVELKDAMMKEDPAPADDEKIADFLGHHSDGIAKLLNLTGTIFKNKNNACLADIVGTTKDLSAVDAKYSFGRIIKTDDKLSEHAVSITKDTVNVDAVDYKITTPAGAVIKSVVGVAGTPPEDLATVQVIVQVGSTEYTIDNFLSTLPDATTGATLKATDGTEIKLEVPKPDTAGVTGTEATAPVAPVELSKEKEDEMRDTAIQAALKDYEGKHLDLKTKPFDIQLPYVEGGVVKTSHVVMTNEKLTIDAKEYKIVLPEGATFTELNFPTTPDDKKRIIIHGEVKVTGSSEPIMITHMLNTFATMRTKPGDYEETFKDVKISFKSQV